MSTSQAQMQSSPGWSEEERQARQHRAYVYCLSLRPKQNPAQGAGTDDPSLRTSADGSGLADENTEDDPSIGPQ
jgi:hypothetical protein